MSKNNPRSSKMLVSAIRNRLKYHSPKDVVSLVNKICTDLTVGKAAAKAKLDAKKAVVEAKAQLRAAQDRLRKMR